MKQLATQIMNHNILIVVAHRDDEVLGCGATIAKYIQAGSKVRCLFMGRGKASRYSGGNNKKIKKEQGMLDQEAKKAAKILGISEIIFEDFPDQQYDTVPFLKMVKVIEGVKNKFKPDIIFTHHQGDLNLDHRTVFRAVMTACRPLKNETVRKIYSCEVPSSTEWSTAMPFVPNVFVDVKDFFNKKIEALKAYQSEIRDYPHPRSVRAVEIIARRWGLVVGKELVEAFELIREITT